MLCKSTRVKYHVDSLKYVGYTAHHYAYMTNVIEESKPTCFQEVVGKTNWDVAMDEEMLALDANRTWELVALPYGKKAIRCKWVDKIKFNADVSISKYKTRLVNMEYA